MCRVGIEMKENPFLAFLRWGVFWVRPFKKGRPTTPCSWEVIFLALLLGGSLGSIVTWNTNARSFRWGFFRPGGKKGFSKIWFFGYNSKTMRNFEILRPPMIRRILRSTILFKYIFFEILILRGEKSIFQFPWKKTVWSRIMGKFKILNDANLL